MKLQLFLLFFTLPTALWATAQTSVEYSIQYYNNNDKKVEDSTQSAYYIKYRKSGDSLFQEYYTLNGTLRMENTKVNGKLEGREKRYRKYGSLSVIGHYKNGEKSGSWLQYRYNGQLQGKGHFKNGKQTGTSRFYHPNGRLSRKSHWKKGKEKGREVEYFPNGQKYREGRLREGRKVGRWTWYYKNGQVKSTGEYVKGYKTGRWYYYHSNGRLLCQCHFESRQDTILKYALKDSSALYFVENKLEHPPSWLNRLSWEGGFLQGWQIFYYNNYKMAAKELYRNGQLVAIKNRDKEGLPEYPKRNKFGTQFVPIFKGNLGGWVKQHKIYPSKARADSIEGSVGLNVFISPNGTVEDVTVLFSPNSAFTKEAIRLIKLTDGNWQPGTSHNVPVGRQTTVIIPFHL